jgi:hypothetical protein
MDEHHARQFKMTRDRRGVRKRAHTAAKHSPRPLSPAEQREKDALRSARRIEQLSRQRRELRARIKALTKAIKDERRIHKAIMQRGTEFEFDSHGGEWNQGKASDKTGTEE